MKDIQATLKISATINTEYTVSPVKPDGVVVTEAYLFNRLSKEIQEKVYSSTCYDEEFYSQDIFKSIEAFLEPFQIKLRDWDLEFGINFNLDGVHDGYAEELQSESDGPLGLVRIFVDAFSEKYKFGPRKRKVIVSDNHYFLTGYCYDYDLFEHSIDLFIADFNSMLRADFIKKYQHHTLEDFIVISVKCAFNNMRKEMDYFYSFERFKEDQEEFAFCYTACGRYVGVLSDLSQPISSAVQSSRYENILLK